LTGEMMFGKLPRFGLVVADALRFAGLRTVLGDGAQCEIVLLTLPDGVKASDLEVVLIDSSAVGDGVGDVLETIATFRRTRPGVRLIVLGEQYDLEHIERVIGAGAKGYLTHTAGASELQMAISVVRDGSVWAPRKVLSRLLESSLRDAAGPTVRFTKRELEVLRLLMMGHPNRQIAQALGVDEVTVKAHMGRLMRKAGVDNRTALSMRALERQWAACDGN